MSPIIINTVITIQSVLSPAGADMPQSELASPVPPDLWERRSWRDLKLWFLEEEGKDEDAQSLVRLIPQGESLQVAISSICLTLEAGVGHRTVPQLLAKSSFHGDVKNWSTLINLHSQLNLEVRHRTSLHATSTLPLNNIYKTFTQPLHIYTTYSQLLHNLNSTKIYS